MELAAFHLALQNAKLMAQEGVFGDQFGFGLGEVCQRTAHACRGRRTQKSSIEWFEPKGEWAKELEEKGNERDV
jgi:hypothetical protein